MDYLVNVRSLVVEANKEEADAVGPAVVPLGAGLHVTAQVRNQGRERQDRVAAVPGGQTLGLHPTSQRLGVSGESGKGDPGMGVLIKYDLIIATLEKEGTK